LACSGQPLQPAARGATAAMAEPPPNGGEGASQRCAHSGLLEFAAAAEAGALPSSDTKLTEELEGIIREVAETGVTNGYPWDALRQLLARKVEIVLGDFWRDAPDVQLQEGESFEGIAVEPLRRSLCEPRREGAPFTVQRLCELLVEPRVYKSTRKYLYAVQRAVVVSSTEEAVAAVHSDPPEAKLSEALRAAAAVAQASTEAVPAEPAEVPIAAASADDEDDYEPAPLPEVAAVATEAPAAPAAEVTVAASAAVAVAEPAATNGTSSPGSPEGTRAGQKRKLPPELSNGVVE